MISKHSLKAITKMVASDCDITQDEAEAIGSFIEDQFSSAVNDNNSIYNIKTPIGCLKVDKFIAKVTTHKNLTASAHMQIVELINTPKRKMNKVSIIDILNEKHGIKS